MTAEPKTSRYTDLVLRVTFQENKNLFYVPSFFLQDQSWLHEHYNRHTSSWKFSEQVGHVLIHYLYTGDFQPLTIENEKSVQIETLKKLRFAVQVFLALGYWQIPKLQELVQSEIGFLSKSVHPYHAFYIVDDELHNSALVCKKNQEEWLINFLMTSLNEALEVNSISRGDLSLFNNLKDLKFIKSFATKFLEFYISQTLKMNEKVEEKPDIDSQSTESVSTVDFTPDTLSSDEVEIKLEDLASDDNDIKPEGKTSGWDFPN